MTPDDLIEGGMIQDTDLDGGPPGEEAEKLESIGRYMLLEELGRGGAGVVYRALDTLLNREVALKRLRFGDFDLESRFLREAELLALLSHPGIMPIFDFGREGDSYFYTMPLASGLSLDRWVAERKPDPREAARLVRQAAEALAHAHERGVLHRDVKPANILVSENGDTLLADFGLGRVEAAAESKEPRMTESGKLMGTPGYMAPEFISGDLKGVDARCDVYALGATLYETITGRPPFVGKSSMEIMGRVMAEDPAPPRKHAPNTPVDLEIVCLKALERLPARRYATAREFADDLGRFIEGEPIRARRATLTFRVRRFVGRRRAIVTVAAIGLLVAAGIAGYAGWRASEDVAKRRRIKDILDKAALHAGAINDLLRTESESDPRVEEQSKLAFEEIDKALAIDPDYPDAHFQKGRVYSLLFKKDEARRCYEVAIAKGPVARAYLERAFLDCQDLVILRADGARKSNARIEELKSGVRRDLQDFKDRMSNPAEVGFANALLEFSKLDRPGFEAAARGLEAYTKHTLDWRAFFWKGLAELEIPQFAEARESFKTALRFRSHCRSSALIRDRLGLACHQLNEPEEAESQFRQALKLDPNLLHPKVNLASMMLEAENFEEAIRWSEEGLKVAPSYANAHAIRGQAYVMKHMKLKADSEEGRPLLRAAKESLEVALSTYPADSEQGRELKRDLDYVLDQLGY